MPSIRRRQIRAIRHAALCVSVLHLFVGDLFGSETVEPPYVAPASPAGVLFSEFLDAYNSGEIDSLRGFVASRQGAPSTTTMTTHELVALHDRYGKCEARYPIEEGPREVSAWIYSDLTRVWIAPRLKLDLEGRIEQLHVVEGLRPEGEPRPEIPIRGLPRTISRYLHRLHQEEKFSGSLLVTQGTDPLFRFIGGTANRDESSPILHDTRFPIGRLSEFVTLLAVGKLLDAGSIELQTALASSLPDLQGSFGETTTVEDLLTHRSGCAIDRLPDMLETRRRAADLSELLPHYNTVLDRFLADSDRKSRADSAVVPKGTFCRSRVGMDIAGGIVEQISGITLSEFVAERILADIFADRTQPPGVAELTGRTGQVTRSYSHYPARNSLFDPDSLYEARYAAPRTALPSDGFFLTADELLRLVREFAAGRILTSPLRDRFLTPTVPRAGTIVSTGCAVSLKYSPSEPTRLQSFVLRSDHIGGSASFEYFPASDITVIVLANEDFRAIPVADYIAFLVASIEES